MDNDRIPTQTQFTFAPRDATPEEIKAWHESEGKWWADRAMITVAIASFHRITGLHPFRVKASIATTIIMGMGRAKSD